MSWSQDDASVAVDNTVGSNDTALWEPEEVLELDWCLRGLSKATGNADKSVCTGSWTAEASDVLGLFSSYWVVVVLKVWECAVSPKEVEGCGVPWWLLGGCPIFLQKKVN